MPRPKHEQQAELEWIQKHLAARPPDRCVACPARAVHFPEVATMNDEATQIDLHRIVPFCQRCFEDFEKYAVAVGLK